MTPSEVESQIAIPIEMGMGGIPYKTLMRSTQNMDYVILQ